MSCAAGVARAPQPTRAAAKRARFAPLMSSSRDMPSSSSTKPASGVWGAEARVRRATAQRRLCLHGVAHHVVEHAQRCPAERFLDGAARYVTQRGRVSARTGAFWQRSAPHTHMRGAGCPPCGPGLRRQHAARSATSRCACGAKRGARTLVVRRSVGFGPNNGRRARLLHLRAPRVLARELCLLWQLCCVARALFRAAARLCGGVALRRVNVLSAQPRRALRQRGVGRLHALRQRPTQD